MAIKCFVIMPYAPQFDDVFSVMKQHTQLVDGVDCHRLDEAQPAGRITERLLRELQHCRFCIADISGFNPNVMWETGYAMALGKPIIVLTQDASGLPFDMRDLQSIVYDRSRLVQSLGVPLVKMVRDTVAHLGVTPTRETSRSTTDNRDATIAEMSNQLKELRDLVGQAVATWTPSGKTLPTTEEIERLAALEGAWLDEESQSHAYIKTISGRLVAPYCYKGNDHLTGYYYDWKKLGDYYFGRFRWVAGGPRGFAFFKVLDADEFHGSWWAGTRPREASEISEPPTRGGVASRWIRQPRSTKEPKWAVEFFNKVRSGKISEYQ